MPVIPQTASSAAKPSHFARTFSYLSSRAVSRQLLAAPSLLVMLSLAACGGGGETTNPTPTTRTVTVSTSGTGAGTVTSAPAGITCGATCSASFATTSAVTLTAAANATSTFAGWSGACSGTSTTCTIPAGSTAASASAQFTLNTFTLTAALAGTGAGSISSSPAGITCGSDCTESYNAGTAVTLTATPNTGSTFTGWSGGGCTGTGTCAVTMNAATTVTATFTITTQLLTVTPAGTGGGTVTSAPAGINCGSDCSEPYNFGTTVTLTAAANATSTFTGWSGGGCTGTGTCVVTMNAAATVTATFTTNSYLLTVSKAGAGNGTVTSSPAGVTCGGDCTESYAAATAVTLTAVADATSVFAGWSGAGCSGTGTCLVNMTAANTVTATFDVFSFKWPDSPARYCSDGAATTTCPAGAAGQDGSYTINVPTYGVIGGRVTDNMTGLVWQRTPPLGDITQLAAVTYCDDLSLEGFDDWRLPSFIELLSIVDFGSSGPAFPAAAFPGIPQNSNYWSSTERNTTAAIVINTNWATSTTALKTDGASRLVRCVRGTPITGAFTASGGSVTDGRTKLVWQSGTSPTDLSWLNALAYCEALVLDSNSDWRLPSGKELLSLMDHTQSNPTISPVFASRPATRFWSSSPNRGFPTAAYAARFDSGLSDDIGTDMTLARSVRCVRGG